MRKAIISDIHGNLAALNQVFRRIDEERCDFVVCLGDTVGYGPYPNECIELVQQRCQVILAGNHDHALLGWTDINQFNTYAQQAIQWTLPVIRFEMMELLKNYPLSHHEDDVFYVHSSAKEPEEWHYILNTVEAAVNFDFFAERICFIGHSHVPAAFTLNGKNHIQPGVYEQMRLEQDHRYIINIGSVGQPRDGNADACFVIYNDEQQLVRWIRVAYDLQATQNAMGLFGLPDFLIRRLSYGH